MTRYCSDCAATLSRQNRTGRCRPCALRSQNADPEFQRRRLDRLALAVRDPAYKARHRAGSKRGAEARAADPIKRAVLVQLGRTYGSANIHHAMTPEARARCGAKVRAAHLAWCPQEHWQTNQTLKRAGYRLPERKAMIAAEVAREERRNAPVRLPPTLAEQLARVRAGARVVPKPNLQPSYADRTLGGVATGLL